MKLTQIARSASRCKCNTVRPFSAANATNQQATPTANHPAGNPAMDQQQREANAALNQAQQERANPQVF